MLFAFALGCSDDIPTPAADAPPADAWQRYCWFGGGNPTPGSEVELGTGIDSFELVGDDQQMPLHHGFQGGVHLELSARMRGLDPGDLEDDNAPGPHTLYTVFDANGDIITATDCAFPRQYRALADGWYELDYGNVVVLRDHVQDTIDGQRVRIQVEVQDPFGHYARLERSVIINDLQPPSMDGGVPDAGMPPDAAN